MKVKRSLSLGFGILTALVAAKASLAACPRLHGTYACYGQNSSTLQSTFEFKSCEEDSDRHYCTILYKFESGMRSNSDLKVAPNHQGLQNLQEFRERDLKVGCDQSNVLWISEGKKQIGYFPEGSSKHGSPSEVVSSFRRQEFSPDSKTDEGAAIPPANLFCQLVPKQLKAPQRFDQCSIGLCSQSSSEISGQVLGMARLMQSLASLQSDQGHAPDDPSKNGRVDRKRTEIEPFNSTLKMDEFKNLLDEQGRLTSKAIEFYLDREGLIRSPKIIVDEVKNPLGSTVSQLFLIKTPPDSKTGKDAKTVYVLKGSQTNCEKESEKLEALAEQGIANSLRLRFKNSLVSGLAKGSGKNAISRKFGNVRLPKITRDLEARLPKIALKERTLIYADKKAERRCYLLLHAAQGQSFAEIFRNIIMDKINSEDSREIIRNLGQSIGAMHYAYTRDLNGSFDKLVSNIHYDIHEENLFYDLERKKLTLIDYETFEPGPLSDDIPYMIDYLGDLALNIDPFSKEAQKVDHAARKKINIEGQNFQKYTQLIVEFIEGYASNFPDPLRKQAQKKLYETYYNPLLEGRRTATW